MSLTPYSKLPLDSPKRKKLSAELEVLVTKYNITVDNLTSYSEDMGTVTGTHIAGTGDDSSTVKVKKKKKKDIQIRFKLKNQKLLKKRILDNVLAIQQKI